MKTKYKPRPVISFMEDDVDINLLKQEIRREAKKIANSEAEAMRRQYIIFAVRVIFAVAAILIVIWLYIMIDNFITHQQFQRFQRITNTASLLIK